MQKVIEMFNYPNAHYIKDNIWLGNTYSSLDNDFLKKNNIKVIINCSKHLDFINDNKYIKIRIPIDDDLRIKSNQDMFNEYITNIPKIVKFTRKQMPILIHCRAGMQRSASVISAYLINKYNFTIEKTIEFIHSKRKIAFFPGPNFNLALIMYNNYCKNNVNK